MNKAFWISKCMFAIRTMQVMQFECLYMITHASCFQFTKCFKKPGSLPSWNLVKVKSMQRSGTEAIRTQIQPSKPKREINKITNSQNTKRTYGQPSKQLFPKRWPLSNPNRTKNDMNTRKVKRHRNSDNKNRQQRTTKNYRLGTVSNELLGGLN